MVLSPTAQHLEGRLARKVARTSDAYGLLSDGDRILVAISGGKDSYSMLTILERLRRRLPFDISLVAVHLDQRQPNYDGRALAAWLEDSGFEYEILSEDTYKVVLDHVETGGTYCAMCSRLRRGILYTAAERLGCNKLALGHHREDTLETFLMNLFYAGKLQAMPAKYTTDDQRFEVIRPLIECAETEIAEYASEAGFPIIPCNLCGSQPGGTKRDAMGAMLERIEAEHPNVRSIMKKAIANVRPTHLLDGEVLQAWLQRDPSIRPAPAPRPTENHHDAEPIAKGHGRLRVL